MNLPLSVLVTGLGASLIWVGIANPPGGLTGAIGRALRGEAEPARATGASAEQITSLAPAFAPMGGAYTATAAAYTSKSYPGLGSVLPHVKAAAAEIGARHGVATVYGFGARDNKSDHPLGLALDFMTPTQAQGDAVAAYTISNAARLAVTYVIWRQRIWTTSKATQGWVAMGDRGSITANHFDHVHVSFRPVGLTGGVVAA